MLRLFKKQTPKLLVIGLDCAAPQLVFEQWRQELPNLDRLMSRGVSRCAGIKTAAWS